MNQNGNKRKQNRIQGGWGKSTNQLKISTKSDDIIYFDGEIAPQFDKNAAVDVSIKCKFIEIAEDGNYDLNEGLSKVAIESCSATKIPASVQFKRNYVSENESDSLFEYFVKNLPWEQRLNATIAGDEYMEPRQTCWYGLPYSYSRVNMAPNNNWDPKLHDLMTRIQSLAEPNKPFNSVMCNLYRSAKDSIDWHSDDEKSLGRQPLIASISLGATRVFELCKRDELFGQYKKQTKNPYRSRVPEDPPFEDCSLLYRVFLNSGSLLTMSGSVQDIWLVSATL